MQNYLQTVPEMIGWTSRNGVVWCINVVESRHLRAGVHFAAACMECGRGRGETRERGKRQKEQGECRTAGSLRSEVRRGMPPQSSRRLSTVWRGPAGGSVGADGSEESLQERFLRRAM